MNQPEICCIGHITLDKIVTPRITKYMPGGTAYYFAHGIHCLDHPSFQLVTSLAETEMNAVEEMRRRGIDVKVLPSKHSVYFENKYGENQNNRTQRVLAKADPFTVEGLKDVQAKIIHLGSLLADDFSLDVIKYLHGKGTLSVDAQGYLREVRGEEVVAVDWPEKIEALKYIDILKTNEYEMEVFTGEKDPHKAALTLADWGVKEVVLTLGDYGSIIYCDGEFSEVPAYEPLDVVDATGCGDTYMTGYLYKRSQGASCADAGRFAAAMSTIKLQDAGPFNATEAEVNQIIHTGKNILRHG
ncbi:MAG: PfkB family carbohydrate kinase [Bacteroidales bacterium]|nr:PfkB family carbohydrate kinase [Bacteroidales bacterium]